MRRLGKTIASFLVLLMLLTVVADAFAAKKKRRARRPAKRAPVEVTVPVNVGVGPSMFMFYGPVMDDQTFHPGIRLDVFGIIDAETIRKAQHKIPPKYRKMAAAAAKGGGIRIRPLWYLPKSLVLSPKVNNTGIFGINFMPLELGLALSQVPRLGVSAGLLLSYAYVTSSTLPTPTHFLRPGLELKADLEIPMSKDFLVSVGYSSSFYPPQELGGPVFEWGDPSASIWHVGQLYLLLHFRFPYTTRI